ncbi:MAG TPA: ribose-phosphate pyrophosphokinase [Chthonomonadales bacterium]|nr:ribose-phosphate pyrophosphokinase [Chthonomonadales bacterium]
MSSPHALKVFAGSANPNLAHAIADRLGLRLGDLRISRFADGETYVKFEESVRGADVYVIQPTCPPVDTKLMELLICIDALRRASAYRITAVMPYYGYARQEKKDRPREPITAKLVADLIGAAGAHRVMCMDLHADAIQGFFNMPVDHLTAIRLFTNHFREMTIADMVVVSPDEGRVKKTRQAVASLRAPLAVGYKHHPGHQRTEVTHLAGDVRGRAPVIIEDMITSGGSMMEAVDALMAAGCKPEVHIACSHGVFTDNAVERLASRPEIAEIVTTDSIPLPPEKRHPKVRVLSVAGLFAEAIRRANQDLSISSLFEE